MSLALVLHPAEDRLERLISFGAQHLPQGGGKLFDFTVPAEVVEVGQECSTIPLAIHCLACRREWQPSSVPPELRPEVRLEHVSNILSKKALISSTLSGVGTQYTGAMITGVGQVVVTAVLARLLTPTDYGLAGLAAVYVGLAAIFA